MVLQGLKPMMLIFKSYRKHSNLFNLTLCTESHNIISIGVIIWRSILLNTKPSPIVIRRIIITRIKVVCVENLATKYYLLGHFSAKWCYHASRKCFSKMLHNVFMFSHFLSLPDHQIYSLIEHDLTSSEAPASAVYGTGYQDLEVKI